MARFILDVGNLTKIQIQKVMQEVMATDTVSKNMAVIDCIDETNENQLYSAYDVEQMGVTNELSQEQIENFSKICNTK